MALVKVRKLKPGPWHGYDLDGKYLALAGEGDEREMSEERAARLVADFPGGFEVVGATGADGVGRAGQTSGEGAPATSKPLAAITPKPKPAPKPGKKK